MRRAVADPVNIFFVFILLVAALLRLWAVGRNGFSGDEAVYAGQAAVLAGAPGYSRYFVLVSRGNSNFLLFQEIVSLFFRVFGVGDLIPRLISALFGIALVAVVYAIGRLVAGPRIALVGMLLAAVSSYLVGLARLALLDTCAVFFMTLAVLLFLLWARDARAPGRRRRTNWTFAAFAAMAVLACEAKVTSVLVLPVVVAYLLLTRTWRHLRWGALLRGTAAALVALVPVLIQAARHGSLIKAALSSSASRTSPVPWTYYLDILRSYEGLAVLTGVAIALLCALWWRRKEDLLSWLWLIASTAFLELYPLKAYNYLLIMVVPLAVLGGAGVGRAAVALWESANSSRLVAGAVLAGFAVIAGAGVTEASVHLDDQTKTVQNPGIMAVAAWLDEHAATGAGVMTLSQGSAQYAVAFYAHRDSYPFGRFRIGTVLPGGTVLTPKPTPAGKLPLDWVTAYPNQFVEDGKISYFVYGLPETDDPSELNYAGLRMTQRNYLALIQTYGGVLVDRIVAGDQNQVLIFQVARRTPVGHLKYRIDQTHIVLTGTGFAVNSPLAVYYHNKKVGTGSSNAEGQATLSVQYPGITRKSWQFVVRDPQGYYAAVGGLAPPAISAKRTSAGYEITGTGFAPGAKVTITYGKTKIGQETVSAQGTVGLVIRGFPHLGPRYRLRLADSLGQFASVDHLTTAKPRHYSKH